MPAFEERPLLAAQLTVSLLQVTAVVRSVNDDGVVELAEFLKLLNKSPDGPIRVVDRATVDCFPFIERAVL